jgi:hypothetical protein
MASLDMTVSEMEILQQSQNVMRKYLFLQQRRQRWIFSTQLCSSFTTPNVLIQARASYTRMRETATSNCRNFIYLTNY